MTVGELIEKLKEFDPALEVGGCGWLGELLEIENVSLSENKSKPFVGIETEWAGNEPD
jgi:hypothetical protein